jgi:hypothetical protein
MIAAATLYAAAAGAAETAGVTAYRATIDNVKYVYATVPPVAHLRPGDVLDTNTKTVAGYSWAPAPTATHARSAFDTDSRLNFLAAAAMRVSAWAKGMGG